ncbi:hypothetical protein [Saccharicrinis fermentans]|uniref:Uncharacterized protein n=1 Tax=Saccharicrinis fermentans DSM 9555 = JCM 21142 TaxID=869213 RepID=W7Y320_9BACT|nr:hypothetical protein [Saccharicrinis fermentans]GAF05225.1 hypothetical protein JCM21142_93952 [Saccharicrinis fermentans DSM 9555 = JCM 21142]
MNDSRQTFSKQWMWISFGVFIVTELVLGALVGGLVVGKFMSLSLRFMLQGLLNLLAYLIGGFIIGLISPGIRIYEPAAGAFLSVLVMLVLTLFTPFSFIHFSLTKVLIGGGIAFFLALTGAKIGERMAGNKVG